MMRLLSPMAGMFAFMAVLLFATACNAFNNGQAQALALQPSQNRLVQKVRAASSPTRGGQGEDYSLPAPYDFDTSIFTTPTESPYPAPDTTALTFTSSVGYPSLMSSQSGEASVTPTTEPGSVSSNGPEIESTSTATTAVSSGGAFTSIMASMETSSRSMIASSFSSTPLFESSKEPVSQINTNTATEKTVTVTVTNFMSSMSMPTVIHPSNSVPIPVPPSDSSPDTTVTPSISVAPSDSEDASISVITITSLSTITFSRSHSTTSTDETSSAFIPPEVTSKSASIPESQHTMPTTNGVSIITVTRTATVTASKNVTISMETTTTRNIVTSTIEATDQSSRISVIPISINPSTIPSVSTMVSGAVTSLPSSSFSGTAGTASRSVNVTLSILPGTVTRGTGVTITESSAYSTVTNATTTVVTTLSISTLFPPSAPSGSDVDSASMSSVTVGGNQTVTTSTQVITITVYPTPLESTISSNGTSERATHTASGGVTVVYPPFPAGNSTSMVLSTGSATAPSIGPVTTGHGNGGATSSSMSTINSSVAGTASNTTTSWLSGAPSQPTQVDTTCLKGSSQNAASTAGSTDISSGQAPTSEVNETPSYPLPTTFRTTVSPSSSSEDQSTTAAYPSLPGEALPGSPNYPWGGSGPLHRLQGLVVF